MGAGGESSFHALAVDDNVIERKVIERLLRTSSFQVTTVDSGIMALEFLGLRDPLKSSVSPSDHQEVDLVITDYCMPGMTGYALLKKINESSSRNIPVVIMPSENVPSRTSRCLEGGAEEFLLKPVKLSDLNRLKLRITKTKMKVKNAEQSSEPEDNDSKKNKRKPWKMESQLTEPEPYIITAAL